MPQTNHQSIKADFESQFAPNTFSSGKYVFCVGDFQFYWIITALTTQIQVLRELYAETNEVGVIARMGVDGAPVLNEASLVPGCFIIREHFFLKDKEIIEQLSAFCPF
jgi:hypothetical protein